MNGAALDKFRKICGMLGSEHDGERANAARLASSLLKQSGMSWNAISLSSGPAAVPGVDDVRGLQMQIGYWQMMLKDERERTKRLSSDLDKLKRLTKTLELKLAEHETGVPPAEQRKRERADKMNLKEAKLKERQRLAEERASNPRSEMPIDAELRAEIEDALTTNLPDRTREFLASVKDQKAWTFKQREAIRKTLRWVHGREAA